MSKDDQEDQDEGSGSPKQLALQLGAVQREAKDLGIPAVVVVEGLDGSGKGRLLNRMILQMDARAYDIYSTHAGDTAATEYPLLWRMWTHVPSRGRLQVFDRSAYYLVLDAWAEGAIKDDDLPRYWRDIASFERQLADDGALIVKILLVVSKKEQARRFKELAGNPSTAWRVTDKDWRRHKQYDDYLNQANRMIAETGRTFAPWHVIKVDDLRNAAAALYTTLVAGFEKAVAATKSRPAPPDEPPAWVPFKGGDRLGGVDLARTVDRRQYKKKLKELQSEIHDVVHEIHALRIPVVMVYCGWDASGKGGCIRRLLQGIDPRSFKVIPIGAPTTEELHRHYLWRFWNKLRPRGKITIFDRSWYGRVLVERVEGLCTNAQWQRAYQEINEMESHLADFGTVVIKFWLHIGQATQLERFHARQTDPHKQWKITGEDWRNREKYDLYCQAVNEMVGRTDTPRAPWNVVPSTCKMHARLETLEIALDRMKKAVKRKFLAPL